MSDDLTPAMIGLLGALIGALAGLGGVLVSLRHSATQEARRTRRDIYTDFLSAAIEMSSLQARNLRAAGQHFELRERVDTLLAGNWRSRRHGRQLASQLSDPYESIAPEFEQKLDSLLWKAHRLKLVAPRQVHEASMYIYDSLGGYLPFYSAGIRDQALSNYNRALVHFADVARSDIKSPGRTGRRDIAREHTDLGNAVQLLHEQCEAHVEQFADE